MRRTLAQSFVVTFAMAPMACRTTVDEPVATPDPNPPAPPVASVAPSASASSNAGIAHWLVLRNESDCTLLPHVDCGGEGKPACPPSRQIPCPAVVKQYPAYIIREGGSCKVNFSKYAPMDCPVGASCNPPPPEYETVAIDCPAP